MQIGARDLQAARGERLVAVVFAHGGDGQLDLVVAQLALEGAGGLVVVDADDAVVLDVLGQVFDADAGAVGARMMARWMTFSSSRTLPGQE